MDKLEELGSLTGEIAGILHRLMSKVTALEDRATEFERMTEVLYEGIRGLYPVNEYGMTDYERLLAHNLMQLLRDPAWEAVTQVPRDLEEPWSGRPTKVAPISEAYEGEDGGS